MECEARAFWKLSRHLRALRVGFQGRGIAAAGAKIAEIHDELEVMAMHTEWPLLRARASGLAFDIAQQNAAFG